MDNKISAWSNSECFCLTKIESREEWWDQSLTRQLLEQPRGFFGGSVVKNLPSMQEPQEMQIQYLSQKDPLEEGMATHSSILAWRILWTEEPEVD